MDAEQPLRQHGIDNVPSAEADENAGQQQTPGGSDGIAPRSPQEPESEGCDEVHQGMEIAVGCNLEAEIV
jgi:hypothetical protein